MKDRINLRAVEAKDEGAFRAAIDAFRKVHPDRTFALGYQANEAFGDYVERVRCWRRGKNLPEGWVATTFLLAEVKDELVGRVAIRHGLNKSLESFGGHIGFAVVPEQCRKGYGTRILARGLEEAQRLGLMRVLLTCAESNIGSRRIIESNGGVFQDALPRKPSGRTHRYWITHPSIQSVETVSSSGVG